MTLAPERPGAAPPGRTPAIYLVTAAGVPNYGDELILRCWLDRLAERLPDTEVFVDCIAPGTATRLHASRPAVRFVDHLWRTAWAAPSDDLGAGLQWLDDVTRRPDPVFPLRLADDALARCSAMVFVGGGYLAGHWARHALLLALAARARKLHGIRLFASGLGLSPEAPQTARRIASWFSEFDHVGVRDPETFALLERVVPGLAELGPDEVWSIEPPAEQPDDGGPTLNVSINHDLLGTPESIRHLQDGVAELVTLFRHRVGSSGRIRWLELLPGDGWLARTLAGLIEPFELVGFQDLWRTGLGIAPASLCVGSRFHFHLLAAASGACGHALVANEFYRTKHASIVAATGWSTSSFADFQPAALLERWLERAAPGDPSLAERRRELCEDARRRLDHLTRLLRAGGG